MSIFAKPNENKHSTLKKKSLPLSDIYKPDHFKTARMSWTMLKDELASFMVCVCVRMHQLHVWAWPLTSEGASAAALTVEHAEFEMQETHTATLISVFLAPSHNSDG